MPRDEITRFDPRLTIEESIKPPHTWYTSERFLEQEKFEVFEKEWLAVGRVDQVTQTGNYFTGEVLGNPYVVVKDENGLQGFHNVCRHNAAQVALECGTCSKFACPYHGWEYDLQGNLIKAPHLGKSKVFSKSQAGMKPISVDTWGPFCLVDLDGPFGGNANPRNIRGDFNPIWEPLCDLGLMNMKFKERHVCEMNCNWKVFVDNSLDGGYHVAYAHEGLAAGLEFDGYETHVYENCSIQMCETNNSDERVGSKVAYAWMFPNFFINIYGHTMDTNFVIPLGVDKCLVIFDFYFDYEDFNDWKTQNIIKKNIASSHVVQLEDVRVCESTQRGMNSMSYESGFYSSKLEQSVHHFHKLLWGRLLNRGIA
ncbi:MAG: hypothetical protein COA78_20190 [Blastopirellula sp.]|nr:MAG: hypothetical protein COA78_20190 [Blastopirellula sp.]